MIFILITVAVFLIGVVLCYFGMEKIYSEVLAIVGGLLIVASSIVFVFAICVIIGVRIDVNKQIYDNAIDREALVRRVECISSEYEDVSKSEIIKDVYEWNKKVYNQKYYSKNPFTNWFYNKKIVDSLEYVYLEGNQYGGAEQLE